MKKIVFTVLLTATALISSAQLSNEVRIASVDLRYENDKVIVPYKIINSTHSDRYVVWVDFYNEKNQLIAVKTLQGDINTVSGDGEKVITWDAKADGIIINEKITARVNARQIPNPSKGKAFLYSTLFPGAGNYQFKQNRPYWLKGALAYGLISSSVIYYSKSNSTYNKYESSGLPHTEDPNYKSAKNYRQLSFITAGIGIGIWLLDYTSIISKSSKHKKIKAQDVIHDSGYKLYSCTSPSKLINTRSLPPNLFADLEFSDKNGNGILENQETAELKVTISNQGNGDAMLLKINVTSDISDPSLMIQNATQTINVLKPGEKKEVIIPISSDINLKTATHRLAINVSEYYGYDMDPAYLVLNTFAYQPPKFSVSGLEIIDNGIGTSSLSADGKLQVGEQVKVKLVVQNIGQGEAKNATYSINTTDSNIYIDQTDGSIGNVLSGEVKEIYFTLSPNKRVTTKDKLPIFLSISEEVGRGSMKEEKLPISLDQTPPKANIVEVKSNVESLKKNIARFEYSSNKFRTNTSNIINISSVAPSNTKRPKSIGVVIGVSRYKELAPAPYADNDAKVMKTYFEKILGVEQVIMFTNEQVSGFLFDDIFNPEMGELKKAITKGESEVFVFYSGHGIPDKEGKNIYLFPSDGRIARLDVQGYNIEKLYENLSKLGAKHTTVILDACFSGSSRSSAKIETANLVGQKGIKVRPKNSWVNDPNFTIISSSTGEETSLGFDETETGLFTYYLAAGLQGKADSNGDKAITLGELREYVTSNVKEISQKIFSLQTPIFIGDDSLILVKY